MLSSNVMREAGKSDGSDGVLRDAGCELSCFKVDLLDREDERSFSELQRGCWRWGETLFSGKGEGRKPYGGFAELSRKLVRPASTSSFLSPKPPAPLQTLFSPFPSPLLSSKMASHPLLAPLFPLGKGASSSSSLASPRFPAHLSLPSSLSF